LSGEGGGPPATSGEGGGPPALSGLLGRHLARWPGPAALAVLGPDLPVASSGPAEEVFAWASVTKLLVALATWVAVEEGTVSFDDQAGPPGSTLAHLLAHAAGLAFEGGRPIAPPGRRRGYSNAGVELAAAHLARATDMPFGEYLEEAVLAPLGMAATRLQGSPAHGASGPLTDLAALAAELARPTLVSAAMLRRATSVAWPGLAGVLPGFGRQDPCDWGLGPEVKGAKSPHWTGAANSPSTFGHFGQSGSLLWVDPERSLGLVGLGPVPFGPWATEAWPAVADAVIAAAGDRRALSWW